MAWRATLSRNLKEFRLLFSPSSSQSAATRSFIEKSYRDLKTHNPKLPFLIREANSIEPQLWARYGHVYPKHVKLMYTTMSQRNKEIDIPTAIASKLFQSLGFCFGGILSTQTSLNVMWSSEGEVVLRDPKPGRKM